MRLEEIFVLYPAPHTPPWSPSRGKTQQDCNRKLWFDRIIEWPVELSAAQEKAFETGTTVHEDIEAYMLGESLKLKHPLSRMLSDVVEKAKNRGDGHVEFKFELGFFGVRARGAVDLWNEEGVVDWKTTSSILRWSLKKCDLSSDLQMMVYAAVFFLLRPLKDKCLLMQGQMQKDGKRRATPYDYVTRDQVVKYAIEVIKPLAEEYLTIFHEEDPAKVATNKRACGKYKGCPFQEECALVDEGGFFDLLEESDLIDDEEWSKAMTDKSFSEMFGKVPDPPDPRAEAELPSLYQIWPNDAAEDFEEEVDDPFESPHPPGHLSNVMSTRSANILIKNGYEYLSQLREADLAVIENIKGVGDSTMADVHAALELPELSETPEPTLAEKKRAELMQEDPKKSTEKPAPAKQAKPVPEPVRMPGTNPEADQPKEPEKHETFLVVALLECAAPPEMITIDMESLLRTILNKSREEGKPLEIPEGIEAALVNEMCARVYRECRLNVKAAKDAGLSPFPVFLYMPVRTPLFDLFLQTAPTLFNIQTVRPLR